MNLAGSFLNIDIFVRFLTFAIFVVAGLDLSRFVPPTKSPLVWSLFACSSVIAAYVAWTFPTVTVLGFSVFLDMILAGLWSGLIAGIVVREYPKIRVR